ncbi:MAG TPA: vWA domain-containing protein [Acidobacteriota bacterium]|nr:vWA domain-containing protein [Acidobacteriota bacterium]
MNNNGKHTTGNARTGATRIALVLDRSGSMANIQEPAREAFNEAVDRVRSEAAKGSGDVTLSLITFNEELRDLLVNKPADRVRKLRRHDYRPGGCTALFDAVDHAIDLLVKPGPLGSADGALVIVISDGQENASTQVSQADLVERIQKLEATDQWTFSFMCANVDITDLSRNLGVDASNAAAWQPSAAGTKHMGKKVSDATSSYMADRREGRTAKKDFWDDSDKDRQ